MYHQNSKSFQILNWNTKIITLIGVLQPINETNITNSSRPHRIQLIKLLIHHWRAPLLMNPFRPKCPWHTMMIRRRPECLATPSCIVNRNNSVALVVAAELQSLVHHQHFQRQFRHQLCLFHIRKVKVLSHMVFPLQLLRPMQKTENQITPNRCVAVLLVVLQS